MRNLRHFSLWNDFQRVLRSDERGQAIVIIALAMIGLVAFAGLIFDGGTAYAQRRRMQNGADAGALAGARILATGAASNNNVNDAIIQYAISYNGQAQYGGPAATYDAWYLDQNGVRIRDNGGNDSSVKVNGGNPPNGAVGVEVDATATFNTFFMNVLGLPVGSAGAVAKARFAPITDVSNDLLPITPNCPNINDFTDNSICGYQKGTTYTMMAGGGAGNFGWLLWNNTHNNQDPPTVCTNSNGSQNPTNPTGNAVLLCDNLRFPDQMQYQNPCNPLDTTVSVSDCVYGTTGVKDASYVRDALASLVDNQTVITIPIWDTTVCCGSGSNLTYHIIGFASFVVQGFHLPQGGGGGGGTYYPNATIAASCNADVGSGCILGKFVGPVNYTPASNACLDASKCKDSGVRTVTLIPSQ